MLHYDYTVSGSFYKNQDDIGFGLIIKLSYSRYGQHVKTPDYFINPSGVLHCGVTAGGQCTQQCAECAHLPALFYNAGSRTQGYTAI